VSAARVLRCAWESGWWRGPRSPAPSGSASSLAIRYVTWITASATSRLYQSAKLNEALMTPLRTAALVVLFTLAALSAVETLVESYNLGGGLWAARVRDTSSLVSR
jgi:hypothetical protein